MGGFVAGDAVKPCVGAGGLEGGRGIPVGGEVKGGEHRGAGGDDVFVEIFEAVHVQDVDLVVGDGALDGGLDTLALENDGGFVEGAVRGRDADEVAGAVGALHGDDDGAVAGLDEGGVDGGEHLLGAADGVGADGGEFVGDAGDYETAHCVFLRQNWPVIQPHCSYRSWPGWGGWVKS